jgi:hypothetical protein
MKPAMTLCAVALLAGTGCNRYELFRVGGFEQATFSNKADILFIIDNSDSMVEEASGLADNFSSFVQDLQSTEDTRSYEGLADAVENYASYVQNRGSFVDYQFAITTTDVGEENGELVGDTPIIVKGSPSLAEDFRANLLCEATCFTDDSSVDAATAQELDSLCGTNQWLGNCGSAGEQPLEAAYKAICRAVPNPPSDCFEESEEVDLNPLDDSDVLSNEGFLREGSTFIPVIVSDEGDDSVRLPTAEPIPAEYEALFNTFQHRMAWVAIAPTLDENYEIVCPGTATEWGVIRYKYMVEQTNGLFIPIDDATLAATDIGEGACGTADFGEALEQLGNLLQNLFNAFPLASVPDEDTILVFVDGEEVPESPDVVVDQFGIERYEDGWTYRPEDNSVVFHGEAIPGFDSEVQVFYQPVDGMPRELPF